MGRARRLIRINLAVFVLKLHLAPNLLIHNQITHSPRRHLKTLRNAPRPRQGFAAHYIHHVKVLLFSRRTQPARTGTSTAPKPSLPAEKERPPAESLETPVTEPSRPVVAAAPNQPDPSTCGPAFPPVLPAAFKLLEKQILARRAQVGSARNLSPHPGKDVSTTFSGLLHSLSNGCPPLTLSVPHNLVQPECLSAPAAAPFATVQPLSSAENAEMRAHAAGYWDSVYRPPVPTPYLQQCEALQSSLLRAPGIPLLWNINNPDEAGEGSASAGARKTRFEPRRGDEKLQLFEARRVTLIEQLLRLQLESYIMTQLGPLCHPAGLRSSARVGATTSRYIASPPQVLWLHRVVASLLQQKTPSIFVPKNLRHHPRQASPPKDCASANLEPRFE
jgi:hypothetical protein